MLIRKINSVFMRHSRWLFGIFTAVIILSFVGFLTPTSSIFGVFNSQENQAAGSVYGKKVTNKELHDYAETLTLMYNLVYGGMMNELTMQDAFNNYAISQAAKRMGIGATDMEIAKLIQVLPMFQENGRFDKAKYDKTMKMLETRGVTGKKVSAALAEMIIQSKLQQQMAASVVCTDNEAETFYLLNNQEFKYKTATFQANDFKSQIKQTGTELNNFFKANRMRYLIPAGYNAAVASFPYNSPQYVAEAEKMATPENLKAFFAEHTVLYQKLGKDGNLEKAPAYDQVKAEVKKDFIRRRTELMAGKAAQDLAKDLYAVTREADDKNAAFDKYAKDKKVKFEETGLFSAADAKAGKFDDAKLLEQIAHAAGSIKVTNSVLGKDAAMVAFVRVSEPSREAEFAECSVKVQKDYVAQQSMEKAIDAANEQSSALAKLPLAEKAKAFNAMKNCKFNSPAAAKIPLQQFNDPVLSAVRSLKVGETSGAIMIPDAVVIVLLENAKPATLDDFIKNKEQWKMYCLQDKMGKLQSDFFAELSANCKMNVRNESN